MIWHLGFWHHPVAMAVVALILLGAGRGLASDAGHGFSPLGSLRYPANFEAFDYVNPSASKGGTLRFGSTVNFDSTNPMRSPGKMPNLLAYSFDSLMVRAEDEAASYYGLLAQRVRVAPDLSSLEVSLRESARWHDGTPVTAEDVRFTFETLRAHGLPAYRNALRGVSIDITPPRRIVFRNDEPGNWRYLDVVATFPIQSKRFWSERDPSAGTLDVPLGSGPYRVETLLLNDRVTMARVEDYWGRDLPVSRGQWNFERIETVLFNDATAMIEALKTGLIDMRRENDALLWQKAYQGAALDAGEIVLDSFARPGAGQMMSLVFNRRRAPLEDIRVREALALAFDAEWTRQTLFGGLYAPMVGFYGNTELGAVGPITPEERALLAPFAAALPEGLSAMPSPPTPFGADRRLRLRRADKLLTEAGWVVRDGQRVKVETGEPLTLRYVGAHASLERILTPYAQNLARLGITLSIEVFDYIVGRRRILNHDFELTALGWTPSVPAGEQEALFWHSVQAVDHGYGLAGMQIPAVDATIETMRGARSLEEILPATRALDRLLRWDHAVIPLWQSDEIWIAHDAALRFPSGGTYRDPVATWWYEAP
ncbi:MAG: extracellular solute-binding protein [Pseudomonadota bacterium]